MKKFQSAEKISIGISVIALLLSCVTAYFQFKPVADRISVVKFYRSGLDEMASISNKRGINIYKKYRDNSTISPISWDVTLYNPTPKNISIVDVDVFYMTSEGKFVYGPMIVEMYPLSLGNAPPNHVGSGDRKVPFDIGAFSSQRIHVSLEIPIKTPSTEMKCPKSGRLEEIEECFYKNGRDIIGNSVKVYRNERMQDVIFTDYGINPEFPLILKSGDGSVFTVPLQLIRTS